MKAHSEDAKLLEPRCLGLIAALLAVLLVIVLVVFGDNLATDDDMGIALALSGVYPDSGLSLFVNAFLSRLTLLISGLFPGANAFFLVEYCLAAMGVFVFVYVAIAYIDDRVVALCVIGLFVLLLMSGCTFRKNFTVVATVIALSGFFALVMQVNKERLSIPLSIVAIILCVFGFMMRWESFLLTIPFAAIALAYKVWLSIANEGLRSGIKGTVLRLIPFAAVIVLCIGAYAYDAAEWSAPEWSEWKSYNHARSTIIDYPMPDYSDIEEELSAGGITEIDYSFSRSWRTADKDVFTIDSLEFIASFGGEVGDEVVPEKMAKKAQAWVVKYWYAIPLAIALLVSYIVRARRLSACSNIAVAITIAVFAIGTVYLASGGRLPQRVMYSLITDAAVCLAVIVGDQASISRRSKGTRSPEKRRRVACALSLLFCVISVGYVTFFLNPSLSSFLSDGNKGDSVNNYGIAEYIRDCDDSLFVVDASVEYRYLDEYGMEQIPPQDELLRLFFLGGWSTNSPYINARNEMFDMDNVMKGLVENERARYLVPKSLEKHVGEMETFLEIHYWNDVVVELEDSFEAGGVKYLVYDFSVAT